MDIIIVNALLREALLYALDVCFFMLALLSAGALLAKNRAMMYWFVILAGIFVVTATVVMAFLTGNVIQLFEGLFLAIVLPISYWKQKRIITAETARQIEKARRIQAKAEADAEAEKEIKATNHYDYMPK